MKLGFATYKDKVMGCWAEKTSEACWGRPSKESDR